MHAWCSKRTSTCDYLGQGDGLDCFTGVASWRGVPFHAGLRPKRLQVDAHHTLQQQQQEASESITSLCKLAACGPVWLSGPCWQACSMCRCVKPAVLAVLAWALLQAGHMRGYFAADMASAHTVQQGAAGRVCRSLLFCQAQAGQASTTICGWHADAHDYPLDRPDASWDSLGWC